MSFTMMAKAKPIKTGSAGRKLVLMMMADIADDNGRCFPSYQHIADVCEMSKRSVMTHMSALADQGLVSIEHRKGVKGNSSNIYHLRIPSEPVSPPSENLAPPSENSALPPSENLAPRTYHSTNLSINQDMSNDIDSVFATWVAILGKQNCKLTAGRSKVIKARLKEGYTVNQLCSAIKGCANSPFHMGMNDRGERYDDLTLICRNGENVEKFIERQYAVPVQPQPSKADNRAALTDAVMDVHNTNW